MKKIVFILTAAILTIACNNLNNNEYLLSGIANGVENGKKVYIEIQTNNGQKSIDTGVIENGKFELKGKVIDKDLGFLRIENEKFSIPFILENGTINFTIFIDSIQNNKIGGTLNNDKFQEFNDKSLVIVKKRNNYEKNNLARMNAAKKNNDTATVNMLIKEHGSFQNEMNNISKNFIKENPNAFLSLLLLENLLMRQYLTTNEIMAFFESLSLELKQSKKGKEIKENLIGLSDISVGKQAPNFSATSPDGKSISLKESLGKVTIIDFWASWCGPCRKENPSVVALYNEFHAQGLNIIGVSLDKDATKWKEAIVKDKLTWSHVSNLKFWDEPIAKQYNVQSIPATFILDAKGNIVAKDLRGDALKVKVKELLGVK
ncbi:redoxin domain-containing protein [Flavobacterium sp. LMO8]|uniref:TlpA disulfide reductase family protein n=1 Tax=Flavobacterium sp. LMO8 TaxID=2654244 RepID=UPI00129090A8|nr:TlpA disulfide reductase family protein [Flavobacterium sp. LMO8]MQP24377.1 redoxin domain-containing protein [Flavobacterium sp. LMO8]